MPRDSLPKALNEEIGALDPGARVEELRNQSLMLHIFIGRTIERMLDTYQEIFEANPPTLIRSLERENANLHAILDMMVRCLAAAELELHSVRPAG